MIRLVAVDLDGTLLDSKKRIPPENKRAIHALVERGIHFAIITGRRPSGLAPYVRELALKKEPWLVCNSGALIQRGVSGRVRRRKLLDQSLAHELMHLGLSRGAGPVIHDGPHGEGQILVPRAANSHPELRHYLQGTRPEPVWLDQIKLIRNPVQVMFANSVTENRTLETLLTKQFADRICTFRTEYPSTGLSLLDVLAPGATKRDGLRFLLQSLSLKREESLAIGDNWNDLGMLEYAGQAVVMGNAVEELKARFSITESNDEAGLARAIWKLALQA